jgi:hypothetical protein
MPSLVSAFYDAAVSPEAWPQALSALTDAAGVAGAAMIIFNKSTGNVDEVCFSGLSAGFKSDYVSHYAALDPFSPLLDGSWKKLSECLPERFCVGVRRSRHSGRAGCGNAEPTRYFRSSPADRS